MWCPVLSAYFCANDLSEYKTEQLSGLMHVQTDGKGNDIPFNYFQGVDADNLAARNKTTRRMSDVFGFTSTTDLTAMVYSSVLKLRFVIPAANLTGTYFKGSFRLGDYFNGLTSQVSPAPPILNSKISVQQLMAIATDVYAMKDGFELSSAVVNDYVITHNSFRDKFPSAASPTALESQYNLGSEIVEFVVLQSPSKNITTGADATFTMIGECMSNIAVYPSPSNVLLYKTFQPTWYGKEIRQFDDVEYHGAVHG